MPTGKLILRMALAALASGAAAGLLPLLVVVLPMWLFDPRTGWTAAEEMLPMLPRILFLAVSLGLVVATLPAFLAGAAMWALARRFEAASRPPAWAAAGAGVGAAFLVLAYVALGQRSLAFRLDRTDLALIAAFLIAGAGTALVFLGVMRLSGRMSADGAS
jgi:hypothetical protein